MRFISLPPLFLHTAIFETFLKPFLGKCFPSDNKNNKLKIKRIWE